MKKIAVIGLVLVLMLTATGCGDEIALSEEENDLVAEYISGALLKHSYDNEWKYRKLKNAQNQMPTVGVSPGTGGSQNSTTGTAGSHTAGGGQTPDPDTLAAMTSALGLKGIQIAYQTYVAGDRYPTGEYVICVPASSGCKVVAFEFELRNRSAAEVTADTLSSGVTMKLTVGSKTVPQSASLLKNDLMGLSEVKIAPGEAYTAAVIFQVPEECAEDLSEMQLTAYVNGASIGQVPGL